MVDTPDAICDTLRTAPIKNYSKPPLERKIEMDDTPNQVTDTEETRAVKTFIDGLVDTWEDALADVDYSLNTVYNVDELIAAMKLAIQINDLIEYLKQYLPAEPAQEQGQ